MLEAIKLKEEISFFEKRYRGYLDQELLSTDTEMLAEDKIQELIEAPDLFFLSAEVLKLEEQIVIFCKFEKKANHDVAKESIEKLISEPKYKNINKCLVIAYFRSIEDKLAFSTMLQGITIKKLSLKSIIKCNYLGKSATLTVNRYDTIQMPEAECDFSNGIGENSAIQGYAFSASLVDLIELYNVVGDELFDQNLRYQIGDVLGVNSSIKDTLEKYPHNFWFLNNGVTICLTGDDTVLSSPREIMLSAKMKSAPPEFSVINGAQTISTAAEYYYSLREKEREKIKEKAKVLVKVIVVPKNAESGDLEASTIAIALNRQKPIKEEDIAYTYPFVDAFNSFCSLNKKEIQIIKRGENREIGSIDLVTFARIMQALDLKPQNSRNLSAKSLLKAEGQNFKEIKGSKEFVDAKKDQNETYKKYFSLVPAINFVVDQKQYAKLLKAIKGSISSEEYSLLNNGKWFFISTIMKSSYRSTIGDCTAFNEVGVLDLFKNEERMKEYLIKFVQKLKSYPSEIGANSFKGTKLSNWLLEEVDENFKLDESCYSKE